MKANSLEEVRIDSLPSNAYYISNFISEDEERWILRKLEGTPKPAWKNLFNRRLQTWPSELIGSTLLEGPLLPWLRDPVIPRLLSIPMKSGDSANIFSDSPHSEPNHVLINEYVPGNGIMPHKDGPAYHPVVCTVSLENSICLDIYEASKEGVTNDKPRWRIYQEPRSLLILSGAMYTDYLHGIAEVKTDDELTSKTLANWKLLGSTASLSEGKSARKVRTSLTYRDVIKVSKAGAKLGLRGR